MRRALLLALAVVPTVMLVGQEPQRGKKFAVLIGVKSYDNVNFGNLYYTENDVVELSKLLKPQGFDVTLLSDSQPRESQPSRTNIMAKLDDVLRRRQRDDIVLFAFAGHGLQFKGDK